MALSKALARVPLLIVSLAGVGLFGGLFALTYGVPDSIERAGQDFIKQRITMEAEAKFGESNTRTLEESAAGLKDLAGERVERLENALRQNMAEKVSALIAALCRLDCEARADWTTAIRKGLQDKITQLEGVSNRLGEFVEGKYDEVLAGLKRDLRIFLGTNTVLFGLVLIVSLVRRKAVVHLYLPAVLLVVSTVIASSFYLFNQNWFMTIVTNDYVGFAYLAYAALIFAVLSDIMFNRARMTSQVVNAVANIAGSALQVLPC